MSGSGSFRTNWTLSGATLAIAPHLPDHPGPQGPVLSINRPSPLPSFSCRRCRWGALLLPLTQATGDDAGLVSAFPLEWG